MKIKTAMIAGAAASLMMISSAYANLSISGKYFGMAGNANMVNRVITLTPQSKWVNVDNGETVRIVDAASGKSVVWTFDTPSRASGYLASIAPDMANIRVTIYVGEALHNISDE